MENKDIPIFALNLKFYRELNNLTQKDVCRGANISTGAMSSYEAGDSEPKISVAERIAKFFKVNLSDMTELDLAKIDDIDIQKYEIRSRYKNEISDLENGVSGNLSSNLSGNLLQKTDNNSHKEGNDYKIIALQKSLEDKERIIDMLNQRIADKEELNKMLRNEVDRLKNELQGYKQA